MTGLTALLGAIGAGAVKGSAAVALAALTCRLARRTGPSSRHVLWLAALLSHPLCLAAALLPVTIVLPDGPLARAGATALELALGPAAAGPGSSAAGVFPASAAPASGLTSGQLRAVLALAWTSGVVLGWARLVIGSWMAVRRLRTAQPLVGPPAELAAACRREVVPGRAVRFVMTSLSAPPCTFGILRPVVVLPRTCLEKPESLRAVILHELAHVRRLDSLTQHLAYLACCLFWFLPFPWLALRRLVDERERACDQAVIDHGFPPVAYAAALLEAMKGASPNATPAFGSSSNALEGRLRIILSRKKGKDRTMRRLRWFVVPIVFGLIVPLALVRCVGSGARATTQDPPGAATTAVSLGWPLGADGQAAPTPTHGTEIVVSIHTVVTQRFGQQPSPLVEGSTYFHRGIDIACTTGAPVVAAADGTVVHSGTDAAGTLTEAYGCYVELEHAGGYATRYAHLHQEPAEVRVGDPVRRGQVIGRVGTTGTTTGPHLHFEVLRDGVPIDPQTVLPHGEQS